jgi:hypothetical protein
VVAYSGHWKSRIVLRSLEAMEDPYTVKSVPHKRSYGNVAASLPSFAMY